MVNYKLVISQSAEKSLRKIPKKDLAKIIDLIQSLSVQPKPLGCRKLSGEEETYRIRHGNYRVIYEIKDGELLILALKVGHRKDVYRKK